jgi:hypothetical protein
VIARLLLAAAVALLPGASGAAQGLSVGEAFAVMPMPDEPRAQLAPVVAYDGKGVFLVVWQQGRFYHQSQSADILAARVDSRGRVLDRQPIVVCNAQASQEQPQVAYAGGRFMVVWHDLRNGRDWDVYGARLDVEGRVLEPNGFLIAGGPQNQASPAVAPADGGFLVVWQHYARYYALQAALIPASGAAEPVQPLKFRGEPLWGGNLALARSGGGWLLSWNDEKGWSQGGGAETTITRRFGRLVARQRRIEVQAVVRSPAVALGLAGGRFASNASSALYAGWGLAGRGNRVATGVLFGSEGATALKNPNPQQSRHWSGWNTERMFTLYDADVALDGPVAVAFGHGMYLAAARQAYSGKPADRNRLLGVRLNANAVRLDQPPIWPLLHESAFRIASPFLAAGDKQFLLTFEQEDAAGRRRVWAKILETE